MKNNLTRREYQVLEKLATGSSLWEASVQLGMHYSNTCTYRKGLLTKGFDFSNLPALRDWLAANPYDPKARRAALPPSQITIAKHMANNVSFHKIAALMGISQRTFEIYYGKLAKVVKPTPHEPLQKEYHKWCVANGHIAAPVTAEDLFA